MTAVDWINVCLLTVCGFAFAGGLYATHGEYRPLLHKLMMLASAALVLGAFGLVLLAAAHTDQIRDSGCRLVCIGWTLTSAVTFHCVLLLTGRTVLFRNWRGYALLYLPAAVVVAADTFRACGMAAGSTRFLVVPVPMPAGTVWSVVSALYSISVAAIGAALLLQWARHRMGQGKSASFWALTGTAAVADALFAGFTVRSAFCNLCVPVPTVFFGLLLVLALSGLTHRCHAVQMRRKGHNDVILSQASRSHMYLCVSLVLIGEGFLTILGRNFYYRQAPVVSVAMCSANLILLGLILAVVNRLRLNESLKEMLMSVIFSFGIPATALWFVYFQCYATWAYIFPVMIISMLFNRRILLGTVMVESILTQLLLWVAFPQLSMWVEGPDYVVRLTVMGLSVILVFYVSHVYISRLYKNIYDTQAQALMAELSQEFISAEEYNLDQKLYAALQRCGRFIQCDRAFLVLVDARTRTFRHSCEWMEEGHPSLIHGFEAIWKDIPKEVLRTLEGGMHVEMADVPRLPQTAARLRTTLLSWGVRSYAVLPIQRNKRPIGALAFSAGRPLRRWNLRSGVFLEIIAAVLSDAIVKVEREKEAGFLAYHDQLTRLPNRTLFKKKLDRAIRLAGQVGEMVGIVFLDLDSFKAVNDTMGHDLGDRLLSKVARQIQNAVREVDTVSRFGGDEFVLLLDHISDVQDVLQMAENILNDIQQPVAVNQQEIFVTASMGIALFPQDGREPEALIQNADDAMYHAKSMGKNRCVLCSQMIKDHVLKKMELTNLLYHAQEKGQLELYYQPQFDMAAQAIVGVEALLRWRLPEKGMVEPAQFIPLAEQSGMIYSIGEWVLETACQQNKVWQDSGLPRMRVMVNLSANQLTSPKLVQCVVRVLKKTRLPPEYLELEITETAASTNLPLVLDTLRRLKAMGVSLAIDDFGSAQSLLSRLKMLPVDRIKIDAQFVQGIEKSDKDQTVLKAMVRLIRSMGLRVVAEGVETPRQFDFLAGVMCDEVQGFFCCRPMEAAAIQAVLSEYAGLR